MLISHQWHLSQFHQNGLLPLVFSAVGELKLGNTTVAEFLHPFRMKMKMSLNGLQIL